MDLQPNTLFIQNQGQGSFLMEVTTPAHQTHSVNTQVNLQHQHNLIMIDSRINYKSPENRQYKISSRMNWEEATGPYGFKLDSHLGYTSPESQEKYFAIQTSHQNSPQERIIELKTTTKTPSLGQPLVTELLVTNQENSYKVKLQTERGQAATMFNWQLETFPQGGVKTFDTAIDLNVIHDLLQEVLKITGSETSHEFYPTRHESENKYQVATRSSHSYFGSRYEGRVSHPSLSKDIAGHVEYSTIGDSQEGSFELDIFPDTADKITGTIRSILIANNTIKVDVDLQARMLQIKPHVTVEAAWTHHTKAIDFIFYKTPSSSPSLKVAAKYDLISDHDATMTVRVVTEEGPVVDISGVIKSKAVPHCNGFMIDAKVRTSMIGNVDIQSEICKPAFIKLITMRPQANKIYITKLGIKLPHIAEISITEADKFGFNKRPITVLGVELVSPTRLQTKIAGNFEEAIMIKEFVMELVESVVRASESWAEEVYQQLKQQAQQKGIHFPDAELQKVLTQIREESLQIYSEVISEIMTPGWEVISRFLQGPTASYIRQVSSWVWSSIIQAQETYTTKVQETIRTWMQEFRDITNIIIEGVTQGAQWVQTGQEPELLRHIIQQLQENRLVELVKREVLEIIQSQYPEAYSVGLQVVEKIKIDLSQDIEKARQYLLNIPATNNYITSIIKIFSNEEELSRQMARSVTSQLMKMVVGVEGNDRIITLTLPLYRPLYSLSQVMMETVKAPQKMVMSVIPYNYLIDTYNTWLPQYRLLLPYNATAMVVGDTDLLTFDGAILRVPRSHCKVVLTSIPSTATILMSHPQQHATSLPEIIFKAGQVQATISPDFTVKLNGQPVSGEQTVPPVTVQVTPHDVKVVSPLLGLHMLKEERLVMVNASGWVLNHTQGLLGSYDGEVANDWFLPSGRNASSLQELVRSWQEDPSCPTPSIIPVNPDSVPIKRYILCQFHFFLMNGCQQVVNQNPFMSQCYSEPTVCTASKAYYKACAAQGVIFPLPSLC